eukprot:1358260-Prymnesium_polylepis.1
MVRREAVSSATRLCGASGTGYESLGSSPVPSAWRADPSAPVSRRWFERRRADHGRGAGRAGASVRPARRAVVRCGRGARLRLGVEEEEAISGGCAECGRSRAW